MFKLNYTNIYLRCVKTGFTLYNGNQYRVISKDNKDILEVFDNLSKRWLFVDTFDKFDTIPTN